MLSYLTTSLLLTLGLACSLHVIYLALTNYLEYRASLPFHIAAVRLANRSRGRSSLVDYTVVKLHLSYQTDGLLASIDCVNYADGYEPRNNLCQYLLFGPRVFHILDAQNLEVILSTKFEDFGFGVRRSVFYPLLGDGIFTQEGLRWKHSRELLRKQFARTQYQKSDLFREHVDNLLARLPTGRGIADLQPLFFKLTLDTTTALLLGHSVQSLQVRPETPSNVDDVAFAENFNTAQAGLAERFRIAPWHFFYNPPAFRRACILVHRYVDNYIRAQNDGSGHRNTDGSAFTGFIDQVAREAGTSTMLRDQLINVLLAGRDTTACCLSWTFWLLVRHPQVMQRLRQEITSVVGESEDPGREQIQKLPYLRNVIRESKNFPSIHLDQAQSNLALRLYPPVPLYNRTAVRTTLLPTGGGPDGSSPILVRRGEVVVYSAYVHARRKSIWGPDAEDFKPERWEDPECVNAGWDYFPFSGGPRLCLGQDFALMEVSYTVVRLLQAFRVIELPPDEKVEKLGTEKQRLTLVLASAEGCRVQMRR